MSARGSSGSGDKAVTLDVQILGRDYKVACQPHERADLLEAVSFLDERMREIREGGKNLSADRIAVMAALNIANELLRERKAPAKASAAAVDSDGVRIDDGDTRRRIRSMQIAIEQTIAEQEKLF